MYIYTQIMYINKLVVYILEDIYVGLWGLIFGKIHIIVIVHDRYLKLNII